MLQFVNFRAQIFVFASLLLAFNQALADHSTGLYDVDALVINEAGDTRWRAFTDGLDEVFIRISGDSIIMDKLKRPPASRYVKQFSYEPVEKPTSNEKGELLSHRIKIQYNGTAMEKYLRDNGFPIWGNHRSDVVVWLAIRDGRNEYVLKKSDQSLIKTSADKALQRRGIPEYWPLYDSRDRKILKVADIRGGFSEPVVKASKRYSRGPALTGSLIWNGRVWQSSWSLLMTSGNHHWSLEDADYNHLINKSIDQAADAMGIAFAVHGVGKNQKLAVVQFDIQAIDSIKKYRETERYLTGLSAVAAVTSLQVGAQSAVFEITLRSTEEDFLNLIKNDAELVKVEVIKTADEPLALLPDDTNATEKSGVENEAPGATKEQPAALLVPLYHYKLIN